MSMIIENVNISEFTKCKDDYEKFVSNHDTLLFSSPQYLELISRFLNEIPKVMFLTSEGKTRGVIPFFEKKGAFGMVLNSLPFYGSNGGCIAQDDNAQRQLLNALENYIKSNKVAAATIINNPLKDSNGYNLSCDFVDNRIGQFTFFDELDLENIDESLIGRFHHKTRNMVRKAIKSNVIVAIDNNKLDFLIRLHHQNMKAIGGIEKPESFFRLIETELTASKDYNLFVASRDGNPIAALLVLYHNKTVEYYTPAIDAHCKSYQPMSLLIYESMKQAIVSGFHCWNWGGTWESQEGVYRFKKRWGSVDKPYYYYTYVNNKELLSLGSEEILNEYPNFFVLPFHQLSIP